MPPSTRSNGAGPLLSGTSLGLAAPGSTTLSDCGLSSSAAAPYPFQSRPKYALPPGAIPTRAAVTGLPGPATEPGSTVNCRARPPWERVMPANPST